MKEYIVGADIGGTLIRVGICTTDLKKENIEFWFMQQNRTWEDIFKYYLKNRGEFKEKDFKYTIEDFTPDVVIVDTPGQMELFAFRNIGAQIAMLLDFWNFKGELFTGVG